MFGKGRLARPVLPQQGNEFALFYGERDVADRLGIAGVHMGDGLEVEEGSGLHQAQLRLLG